MTPRRRGVILQQRSSLRRRWIALRRHLHLRMVTYLADRGKLSPESVIHGLKRCLNMTNVLRIDEECNLPHRLETPIILIERRGGLKHENTLSCITAHRSPIPHNLAHSCSSHCLASTIRHSPTHPDCIAAHHAKSRPSQDGFCSLG